MDPIETKMPNNKEEAVAIATKKENNIEEAEDIAAKKEKSVKESELLGSVKKNYYAAPEARTPGLPEVLEHFGKPFLHGWSRELVYRNDQKRKGQGDVYYKPPTKGKRLRSMVELQAYFSKEPKGPVDISHFNFSKQLLVGPPHDTVRTAGPPAFKPKDKVMESQQPMPLPSQVELAAPSIDWLALTKEMKTKNQQLKPTTSSPSKSPIKPLQKLTQLKENVGEEQCINGIKSNGLKELNSKKKCDVPEIPGLDPTALKDLFKSKKATKKKEALVKSKLEKTENIEKCESDIANGSVNNHNEQSNGGTDKSNEKTETIEKIEINSHSPDETEVENDSQIKTEPLVKVETKTTLPETEADESVNNMNLMKANKEFLVRLGTEEAQMLHHQFQGCGKGDLFADLDSDSSFKESDSSESSDLSDSDFSSDYGKSSSKKIKKDPPVERKKRGPYKKKIRDAAGNPEVIPKPNPIPIAIAIAIPIPNPNPNPNPKQMAKNRHPYIKGTLTKQIQDSQGNILPNFDLIITKGETPGVISNVESPGMPQVPTKRKYTKKIRDSEGKVVSTLAAKPAKPAKPAEPTVPIVGSLPTQKQRKKYRTKNNPDPYGQQPPNAISYEEKQFTSGVRKKDEFRRPDGPVNFNDCMYSDGPWPLLYSKFKCQAEEDIQTISSIVCCGDKSVHDTNKLSADHQTSVAAVDKIVCVDEIENDSNNLSSNHQTSDTQTLDKIDSNDCVVPKVFPEPVVSKLSPKQHFSKTLEKIDTNGVCMAKVVPGRVFSACWFPSPSVLITAAGDKYGHIGLWKVPNDDNKNSTVVAFKPHTKPVSHLSFDVSRQKLFSCSYDSTLRCGDFEKGVFNDVFSVPIENNDLLCNFDFIDGGNTMLVSHFRGLVSLVDVRTPDTKKAEMSFNITNKSLRTVSLHPITKHHFITAGVEGKVNLWDFRNLNETEPQSLQSLSFHNKTIASAYFSEDGTRIISSSDDDFIAICKVSEDVKVELSHVIKHNNQTGKTFTAFKPRWHPVVNDVFITGSMDRQLEIYNANGSIIKSLPNETVCSVNEFHPNLECVVVGANSSGRLHVFM